MSGASGPEYVRVASVDDVRPGTGAVVVAKGVRIALFRHRGGGWYALRNHCPHMGGHLGEGPLDDHVVSCPDHGWQFDVRTGVSPSSELIAVRTHPVRIEGDDVYVGV